MERLVSLILIPLTYLSHYPICIFLNYAFSTTFSTSFTCFYTIPSLLMNLPLYHSCTSSWCVINPSFSDHILWKMVQSILASWMQMILELFYLNFFSPSCWFLLLGFAYTSHAIEFFAKIIRYLLLTTQLEHVAKWHIS